MMEGAGERDHKLVEIAAVYSRPELCVMLTMLRTNGIRAVTIGENHARVQWSAVVALGGVRILVPEADVAFAAELLDETPPNRSRVPVFAPDRIVDLALMLLLTLFLAVPPPSRIPAQIYVAARREPS